MPDRRTEVAITGIGIVSPFGVGANIFWDSIISARCAIKPIANVPTERLRCKIAAEASDFVEAEHFTKQELAFFDRFTQFAVLASREAVKDAGVTPDNADFERTPVILGSAYGGHATIEAAYEKLFIDGASRLFPFTVPRGMGSAAPCQISIEHGFRGPAFVINGACASSTQAIGLACQMIRNGSADLVIAGGTEACLTVGNYKAWEGLRVMSDEACQPFCKSRSGMVLGEGAAILTLESLSSAKRRGAHIYGLICGFGYCSDAGEITTPNPTHMARAIRKAIEDAALTSGDIGHINAHGTGTPINDKSEAIAISDVFGVHAKNICVSATKSAIGHALGAAGALEAVATVLALKHQKIPPTINCKDIDDCCEFELVRREARPQTFRYALSHSFAFGGLNSVLAFEAYDTFEMG